MSSNVLVVGGSRNIGYYSALRLLERGSVVTFLLRSPAAFDNDSVIQGYVKSGTARLVRGDAMNTDDVKAVWAEASKDKPVDLLLFTVGFTGKPTFHPLKGFTITPANLVTQSILNFLCEMPRTEGVPLPKVILISTSGVTASSRKKVPLLLKPLYGYMIAAPLKDKFGAERVIAHCAGWEWNPADGEPGEDIIGKDWTKRQGLPEPGSLRDVIVLRPAVLNDDACLADLATTEEDQAPPYRVGPGEVVGYKVSRKDVAHFIVQGLLENWDQWKNQQLSIAY